MDLLSLVGLDSKKVIGSIPAAPGQFWLVTLNILKAMAEVCMAHRA
jgi:hypothetical protein